MIVITGADGFIGGCMVQYLSKLGRDDLVLVDKFPVTHVEPGHDAPKIASCPDVETFHETSLQTMRYIEKVPRDFFFDWAAQNMAHMDFILHFGMENAGMQADAALLREYSLEFSQRLWSLAAMNRIPLLYAASSTEAKWSWTGQEWTVWGRGMAETERLKWQFDLWVLKQRMTPPLWAGFALPEVYGPGETCLGTAASSVCQLFRQWQKDGRMLIPLCRDSENIENEPTMDRIYVRDVVTVFTWFMNHLPASGFYYLGAGYPRPLSAVAAAIFSALKLTPQVECQIIPFAEILFPQQKNILPLNRINRIGYKKNFTPLEKGIRLYVKNILNG